VKRKQRTQSGKLPDANTDSRSDPATPDLAQYCACDDTGQARDSTRTPQLQAINSDN